MSGTRTSDYKYLRSIPGILKICCMLGSFIGTLCIFFGAFVVSPDNFYGVFFISIAVLGFVSTGCVLLARIFQVWKYKFYEYEVATYEMYLHAGLALAFFIASAIAISLDVVMYSVAAFFGFLTAISYGCDAFLNYQRSRQRDEATQTEITENKKKYFDSLG